MKNSTSTFPARTFIPYVCFFLLLSAWAVKQPQYTWDLLGYIGSSINSTNATTIHDAAFAAIRPIGSDKDIQADNPYRVDVTANAFHFAEQLPFYSIKPAYVFLIKGLHGVGVSFPRAAVVVSAVSNFLLALLLWRWLSGYISGLPLLAASSLIMLSPNILELSRWATPDCLATLVAAVGLYLILERRMYFWGSAILVLDVWVRTDALVLAGIVFAILWMSGRLDFRQFIALSCLGLGSYFAINHFAGNYGWTALFYNSFMGGLTAPGETLVRLPFSGYLHQLVKGIYLLLIAGSFALYVLLGALSVWLDRSSIYADLVVAVLLSRAVSYVLYPNGDQRYTAVLFVVIPIALVIAIRRKTLEGSMKNGLRRDDEVKVSAVPALESASALRG